MGNPAAKNQICEAIAFIKGTVTYVGDAVGQRETGQIRAICKCVDPDIADAAVVGLPRSAGGESVAAAVVLRDGAVFDAEAIREWTRGHLTAYKVPKTIVPFDTLPRSLVGKVQRREVREELLRRRAR